MNIFSKSPAVVILVACSILVFPLAVRTNASGIIYTSYGPTDTFAPNYGIGIEGSSTHFGYFAVAAKFQVTQDASLDSIQVPMWFASGVNSFIFNLCNENSGFPGQVLESFTVSANTPLGAIVTATSQTHPLLTTSQDYWLEVIPGDPTTRGAWCDFTTRTTTVSDRIMSDSGSGFQPTTYYPLPFTVLGSEVPEPSIGSLSLLAFALACVALKGRDRKARNCSSTQ